MKVKKVIAVLTAAMMLSSGCGKKDTKVDDYGDSSKESAVSDSQFEESDAKLSEKLGGDTLDYTNNFSLNGRNAKLDLSFSVPDIESVPVYKATSVQEAELKEDEIVKNLLGDTAKTLNTSDRDQFKEELGDSSYIIQTIQMVIYINDGDYTIRASSAPTWLDEERFFVHNYEGEVNGSVYQLMFSYSRKYDEMIVAFFPTDIGKTVGDPELKNVAWSLPDGMFYAYYKNKPVTFDITEVMSDRPNKCTLSDDELVSTVTTTLKDKLYLSYPNAGISFYGSNLNMVDTKSNDKKCEAIFYNDDALNSPTLEGAVRDGYISSIMGDINGVRVIRNADISDEKAFESYSNNMVTVNNSGVIGFNVIASHNYNEALAENVNLLSFKDAMDSFVGQAADKIDASKIKNQTGDLEFSYVDFAYYNVPVGESGEEYRLSPVWELEARDNGRRPILRVLINAIDGNIVDVFY